MKHYTTIEQSKHLLELGLSPCSADMFYKQKFSERTDLHYYDIILGHSFAAEQNLFAFRNGYEIPCWSLGALLELMPSFIKDSIGCVYSLSVGHGYVEYINSTVSALYATYHSEIGDNTLEACYNMIVWLLENDYIKKGK